jgi:hypothetical protein
MKLFYFIVKYIAIFHNGTYGSSSSASSSSNTPPTLVQAASKLPPL